MLRDGTRTIERGERIAAELSEIASKNSSAFRGCELPYTAEPASKNQDDRNSQHICWFFILMRSRLDWAVCHMGASSRCEPAPQSATGDGVQPWGRWHNL